MGNNNSSWRNWGDHPFVVWLLVITALIAIIVFVTGKPSLPSFFQVPSSSDTPTPSEENQVTSNIPPTATFVIEVTKTEISPSPTVTSTIDGVSVGEPGPWFKSDKNPILVSNQSWESFAWHAYVMKDGNTFKMWYTSSKSNANKIGFATSSDALNWEKYSGNPILVPGHSGEWDDEGVAEPYVIKGDGVYKMWYWGNSNGISQIGYAISPDGITWTKHSGNPVLSSGTSGSWDEIEAGFPSVQYQDGTYKMWYTGKNAAGNLAIGYATSTDGIDWRRDSSNPILSGTAGTWDAPGLYGARVLFDGKIYRIWYTSGDGKYIGYARSTDGIKWQPSADNPVLSPNSTGEWDDQGVYFPMVLYSDGIYTMWYSGMHNGPSGIGYATAKEIK